MHLYTLHYLPKSVFAGELNAVEIIPEKEVSLWRGRKGLYDFFVSRRDGKNVGIEILTRPSKGKLKEKLIYAEYVDEYIFVLPSNGMNFYKKEAHAKFKKIGRNKYFPEEFENKKIKVLLLDLEQGTFSQKRPFSAVFNVR